MLSNNHPNVRPSPIAGHWYPGEARKLAETVDAYLDAAGPPELPGQVIGVIAPHAGYRYSGAVAGYAFAVLRGLEPDLVAVISPSHQFHPQALITSAHDAYQTPLGTIPVDRAAVEALDAYLQAGIARGLAPIYRDAEHSLEIELPFLQRALPHGFTLLPIMLRDQSASVARSLGCGLAEILSKRTALLVASTDLSHFYSQAVANELDKEILRRIEAFDPERLLAAEEEGVGYACGRGAVAAVLWATRALGATTVKLLHYATSGDVTGDYSSVVGYGAAAILRL